MKILIKLTTVAILAFITVIFSLLTIVSCSSDDENPNPFPTETFYDFRIDFSEIYANDTISFHLRNPVKCPIRVALFEDVSNPNLNTLFEEITLRESQDTIVKVRYPNFNENGNISYKVNYGSLDKTIIPNEIAFPFPQNRTYEIIQGYHGSFSHNDIFNEYAIDFSLQIGDTITSTDKGYVVGLVEGYKYHGTTEEWAETDKSNRITMYHPESGLFSQYVHLDHNGALVALGDFVERGQPIGISGMTGFTNIPHLHFNVKIPNEDGIISIPITFEGGIAGESLQPGDIVR